jgi:S1-C subfamily serine protease
VPLRLALTGGAAALVLGGLLAIWVSRPGSAPGAAPTLAPPEPETPGDAPRAAPGPELSAADRAERALASTVALRCPNALGAGFFVAPDLVLTNAHVAVCDAEMRVVLADGRESGAVVLRRDARLDLAVIRALGLNEPPLPLADAGEVRVGDPVTLIGSPVGMEFTVHEGSVSNLPRMVLGIAYIQLDAKINPGNSGGPLIDRQGRVVGIVSMKRTDAEGIGLALPINYAWDGAGSLIAPPGGRRERSEGFARMVQQVKAEEQKLVTELATAPRQPLLVAAGWDRYQRLVAVVVRISGPTPNAEDVKLRVLDGSRQVCEMSGGVSSWRRLETESEAGSREMAARLEQWLASTGVGAQVYGGEVPLRFDLCRLPRRSGYVLELVGADPRADRLRF